VNPFRRLAARVAEPLIAQRVAEVETRLTAQVAERVAEAYSAGMTRADQQLAEQGFRRLVRDNAFTQRDLTPLAQDAMLALMQWLWESNALAQWLIELVVDFVWGEGGAIAAKDEDANEVLKAFWGDPVNQLGLRMDDFTRELGMQGELCLPVFVNEIDGHVRLGYIPPEHIEDIIPDPNNCLVQAVVVLKAALGRRRQVFKVVREETWRASPNYGRLMPAEPNERDILGGTGQVYDGSCILVQVNKLSGARRGRADLLALVDWLDGYDAALFDQLDRAQLVDSFIWDVTMTGADEKTIKAWLAAPPQSVLFWSLVMAIKAWLAASP